MSFTNDSSDDIMTDATAMMLLRDAEDKTKQVLEDISNANHKIALKHLNDVLYNILCVQDYLDKK